MLPSPLTEADVREIVSRVVRRTLGHSPENHAPAPNGERETTSPASPSATPFGQAGDAVAGHVVALGADHGGFALKEALKEFVAGLGYAVMDCGAHSAEPVDYPDLAYAVGRLVSAGQAWRGILVDGAGIGSAMAANMPIQGLIPVLTVSTADV